MNPLLSSRSADVAIQLKFFVDCRSRRASLAMASKVCSLARADGFASCAEERRIADYFWTTCSQSMLFKLNADYKPTGDQPQAIEKLVASMRAGNRYQTLLGVTGS